MAFIKCDLKIDKDTKKYKNYYYKKVNDKYFVFSDKDNTVYTRFSIKDCKSCINEIVKN
jgi:hypothetical protein